MWYAHSKQPLSCRHNALLCKRRLVQRNTMRCSANNSFVQRQSILPLVCRPWSAPPCASERPRYASPPLNHSWDHSCPPVRHLWTPEKGANSDCPSQKAIANPKMHFYLFICIYLPTLVHPYRAPATLPLREHAQGRSCQRWTSETRCTWLLVVGFRVWCRTQYVL